MFNQLSKGSRMNKFKIGSSIWIDKDKKTFLGKGRIELLKLIDKTGSLSKAAKEMKMSYKAAWDSINDMNNASEVNLIESTSGGAGGGGSKLTALARLYIELYDKIYIEQKTFFNKVEPYMDDYEMLTFFLKRDALRISARNQIKAKVFSIKENGLGSLVKLKIDDLFLNASITSKSVKELNLKKNMEVFAIIKSSSIKIAESFDGENIFKAVVKNIENIDNTYEYVMQIDKNFVLQISSKKTDSNFANLNKNDAVSIYINPNDVMIAI